MGAARTLVLGETEVVRIGLGTNRLKKTSENVELVRRAVAAGIGLVDTAHTYTGGESEETIGEALSPRPVGAFVATKGGFAPGTGSPQALSGQIEESLRRLRTDAIDLYYLHRVDPETPLEESLGTIAAYRDRGQILHVGLSQVGIEEIERGREVVPIAAVQNRYSLAERTHDKVIDHCASEGIAFVAFYPFGGAGGSVLAERGAILDDVASRCGATRAQVALAWLLRRSPAVLPIPGTLSPEHLTENVGALRIELEDADYEALV
jgi:aryl-alcohol dehydrogenase-like predicted oxidoreductase